MGPKDNTGLRLECTGMKWAWWAEWLETEPERCQTRQAQLPKKVSEVFPHYVKNSSKLYQNDEYKRELSKMSKRPAEPSEKELETLKSGDRPMQLDEDEVGEFEDEYEDEFESEEEDEIFEAGVDGRPDEEREAEERQG
jgi:hypothetical protein